MIKTNDIIDIYELFYSKVSGNVSFDFKPNKQQNKQIDNFLELLDNKYKLIVLDDIFLIQYFAYQFWKRHNQETRFGCGKIMLNWVIGKKAIEIWDNKKDNWLWCVGQFLNNYNIKINKKQSIDIVTLRINEENEKKLFYNTDTGFLSCLKNTTLYNNKSKYCILCKYKESCKAQLKGQYKNIYQKRFKN
jgi:hypothetical protein